MTTQFTPIAGPYRRQTLVRKLVATIKSRCFWMPLWYSCARTAGAGPVRAAFIAIREQLSKVPF